MTDVRDARKKMKIATAVLVLVDVAAAAVLFSPLVGSEQSRRDQLEQWLETELLESFDPANILPVTRAIGDRWAALSARAQEKGIQPAVIDGLVAATALEHEHRDCPPA